jgi:hypothetical protein
MRCGGSLFTASVPLTMIEPVRRPTRPMMDFSVVVRPAPLRPSSVTTSPFVHREVHAVQDVRLAVEGVQVGQAQVFSTPLFLSSAMGALQFCVFAAHVGLQHLRVGFETSA